MVDLVTQRCLARGALLRHTGPLEPRLSAEPTGSAGGAACRFLRCSHLSKVYAGYRVPEALWALRQGFRFGCGWDLGLEGFEAVQSQGARFSGLWLVCVCARVCVCVAAGAQRTLKTCGQVLRGVESGT